MLASTARGNCVVAEIGLQDHGIGGAFADEAAQGRRFAGAQGRHLGVRPMAGDMMREPLQALGVAAHDHQDWTRICHEVYLRHRVAAAYHDCPWGIHISGPPVRLIP